MIIGGRRIIKGGFLVFLDGSSLNTDGKDLLEGKGDNIKGKSVKRYLRLAKKCTESSRKGEAGCRQRGRWTMEIQTRKGTHKSTSEATTVPRKKSTKKVA